MIGIATVHSERKTSIRCSLQNKNVKKEAKIDIGIILFHKFAVRQLGAVPGFDSIDCCGYKHAVRCVISTLI